MLDCGGRGSRAPRWLREIGFSAPEESIIGVDFAYSSTRFHIPSDDGKLARCAFYGGPPPEFARGGALVQIENNMWLVSLAGRFGDYPPREMNEFPAWARTLHAPGVPDTRIRHASEITSLRCSAHYRAMITTAWDLGSRHATGDPRFRQWAHMLGYGGHFLTKSRRYSVTFGQLRAARTQHRRAQRHPDGERDPWGRPLDETVVLVISTWTYAGTDYTVIAPDVQLALASAARAREH